jgi:hypothetical protein
MVKGDSAQSFTNDLRLADKLGVEHLQANSMKMKSLLSVILVVVTQLASSTLTVAHPGSGIIVDAQGSVFVSDINRGLLKFSPDGKVSVVLKEAGHWLAVDTEKKFF